MDQTNVTLIFSLAKTEDGHLSVTLFKSSIVVGPIGLNFYYSKSHYSNFCFFFCSFLNSLDTGLPGFLGDLVNYFESLIGDVLDEV